MRKWIGGVLIFITLGFIYYSFNPDQNAIFPKCPFYSITGFKCPGCGSQRAVFHLLHFRVMEAIRCNALLVGSLPLACILFYAELIRTRNPKLYSQIHNIHCIWAYLIIIIVWWIFRNVFHV